MPRKGAQILRDALELPIEALAGSLLNGLDTEVDQALKPTIYFHEAAEEELAAAME